MNRIKRIHEKDILEQTDAEFIALALFASGLVALVCLLWISMIVSIVSFDITAGMDLALISVLVCALPIGAGWFLMGWSED